VADKSTQLYLCLDQGGHASRAVIIDGTSAVRKIAYREIATHREGLRVEHDPEELLTSLQQAAAEVLAEVEVCMAGLATQRSSIVCWDRHTGEPLSPVLSWQDRRAADWLAGFSEHEARIHAITGLVLSPHYGVSKLMWCLENLPQVAQALAEHRLMFGPLAAWLAGRLCGEVPAHADPANGSRTLLWDRQSNGWSAELLELFSVPAECLPAAVPTRYDWGSLNIRGDAQGDIKEQQIPLKIVTGDQSAALFAFGAPDTETAYANLGTGAFLQRAVSQNDFNSGRLLASIVYAAENNVVSVLESTVNGAGAAINQYATDNGIDIATIKNQSSSWLEDFAADLFFINTVSGLGSPWWLPEVPSGFVGTGTDEQKLAAILESIAFLITVNVAAGNELIGASCGRIIATGGLGQVDPLLQRVADLTGAVVERTRVTEATARGLAYLLADEPANWPEAAASGSFSPQENLALAARFEQWLGLMPPVPE
jgi:glycerol kinase